jgi:SAM-dependent methyltransferase
MPRPDQAALGQRAVEFFKLLLSEYPQYPAVALWRCWECAWLASLEMASPLLDLGCGDGRIGEHLWGRFDSARPHLTVGLDLDAQAARRAAARPLYAGVVVGDARRLPLACGCLASVVSICVLEHIPHVEQAVGEVGRVLKPGGLFAFSVPTPRLLQVAAHLHRRQANAYVREFCLRIQQYNTWAPGRWQEILTRQGLAVVAWHGFMPPPAARAWFAAYDWTVRPIRGRGLLYRWAGPRLERFGLGGRLARYWFRRLAPAARLGVACPVEEACAVVMLARKPGPDE